MWSWKIGGLEISLASVFLPLSIFSSFLPIFLMVLHLFILLSSPPFSTFSAEFLKHLLLFQNSFSLKGVLLEIQKMLLLSDREE